MQQHLLIHLSPTLVRHLSRLRNHGYQLQQNLANTSQANNSCYLESIGTGREISHRGRLKTELYHLRIKKACGLIILDVTEIHSWSIDHRTRICDFTYRWVNTEYSTFMPPECILLSVNIVFFVLVSLLHSESNGVITYV